MNAREEARKELERIIGEVLQPWINGEVKIENLKLPIKGVASAILNELPSLGFVRLEDVEIDVDSILKKIYTSKIDLRLVEKEEFDKGKFRQIIRQDKVLALARAIAKAKPIRVKEGK